MADQNEIVIFGEFDEACFSPVEAALKARYPRVQSGRQGDSWIWVLYRGGKIGIDTFYSYTMQIQGPRRQFGLAQEIINLIKPLCPVTVFDPPLVAESRN